ncbi:sulfate transmembrane transporter [Perilla frutescens var. hirtella]|nr:sulfate transmembrane transporter [Perilla frutescens var. hirtella]KAH6805628.1 sulfate transmembrane transporter [Perilla frutescens var. frutescens]
MDLGYSSSDLEYILNCAQDIFWKQNGNPLISITIPNSSFPSSLLYQIATSSPPLDDDQQREGRWHRPRLQLKNSLSPQLKGTTLPCFDKLDPRLNAADSTKPNSAPLNIRLFSPTHSNSDSACLMIQTRHHMPD